MRKKELLKRLELLEHRVALIEGIPFIKEELQTDSSGIAYYTRKILAKNMADWLDRESAKGQD